MGVESSTDRSRSDCVHEQVAKWIANVRFTLHELSEELIFLYEKFIQIFLFLSLTNPLIHDTILEVRKTQ